jgi:hypothetical protein
MLGTTIRLNTATTNNNTKSKRPRTRFKSGCLSSLLVDKLLLPLKPEEEDR